MSFGRSQQAAPPSAFTELKNLDRSADRLSFHFTESHRIVPRNFEQRLGVTPKMMHPLPRIRRDSRGQATQGVVYLVDRFIESRRPGRQTDRLDAREPLSIDVGRRLHMPNR